MVQECPRCSRFNVLGQVNCRGCGASLKDSAVTVSEPAATISSQSPIELPLKEHSDDGLSESIGTLPKPGSLVGRRYRIIRLLGEGGTKVVYLALDDNTGYQFALALIKIEGLDSKVRARVASQVRDLARLGPGDHHIVGIHDCGEESGRPYVVAQYMPGGTLAGLLTRSEGHRLGPTQAIGIAAQICQALEYAHSRGVIHRDLKPASVWFSEGGEAKLGDFGLDITKPQSVTKTASLAKGFLYLPRDAVASTVLYMSPEQALGESLDARSDLYSLGVMLYEMVTGRPPFVEDHPIQVVASHLQEPPIPPLERQPAVWPNLQNLILKLLEKDPNDRPQSATEVRQTLAGLRPEGWLSGRIRWVRTHSKPVAGIVGTIMLAVLSNYIASMFIGTQHGHASQSSLTVPSAGASAGVVPTLVPIPNAPGAAANTGEVIAAIAPSSPEASPAVANAGNSTSPSLTTTIVAATEPVVGMPVPAAGPPNPAASAAPSASINPPPPSAICVAPASALPGPPKEWPPVPIKPCGSDVAACAQAVDTCLAKARTMNATAAGQLGFIYFNGLGVTRDDTLAKNWSYIAATKGDSLGQDILGQIYLHGTDAVGQDYDKARDLLQQSAKQNCALAQNDLGDMYLQGTGVAHDPGQALEWYRKAALQNDAMGQNNVGVMYLHGSGVQRDPKQALDWFMKASAQGNPFAQDSLGYMYLEGSGVDRDPKQAFQCFKAAAEQGFAVSQMHLGDLYSTGTGVDKNTDEAVKWYCTAAAAGKLAAQRHVQGMGATCPPAVTALEP
jgi:TPR repeat protein